MLRTILRGAILGAIVTVTGFLLFFLGTWAIESLRGYHFPPPWARGLKSWIYLGLTLVGAGALIGGLSGTVWHLLRNRRPGTI